MTAKYEGPVGWRFLGEVADCRELQSMARLMAAEELNRIGTYRGKSGVRWARKKLEQGTVIVRAELFGGESFPAFRPKVLSWLVPNAPKPLPEKQVFIPKYANPLFLYNHTTPMVVSYGNVGWEIEEAPDYIDAGLAGSSYLCDWQGNMPESILTWSVWGSDPGSRYGTPMYGTRLWGYKGDQNGIPTGNAGQLLADMYSTGRWIAGACRKNVTYDFTVDNHNAIIAVLSYNRTGDIAVYHIKDATTFELLASLNFAGGSSAYLEQSFLFDSTGSHGVALLYSDGYTVTVAHIYIGDDLSVSSSEETYDCTETWMETNTVQKDEMPWSVLYGFPYTIYGGGPRMDSYSSWESLITMSIPKHPIVVDIARDGTVRYVWGEAIYSYEAFDYFEMFGELGPDALAETRVGWDYVHTYAKDEQLERYFVETGSGEHVIENISYGLENPDFEQTTEFDVTLGAVTVHPWNNAEGYGAVSCTIPNPADGYILDEDLNKVVIDLRDDFLLYVQQKKRQYYNLKYKIEQTEYHDRWDDPAYPAATNSPNTQTITDGTDIKVMLYAYKDGASIFTEELSNTTTTYTTIRPFYLGFSAGAYLRTPCPTGDPTILWADFCGATDVLDISFGDSWEDYGEIYFYSPSKAYFAGVEDGKWHYYGSYSTAENVQNWLGIGTSFGDASTVDAYNVTIKGFCALIASPINPVSRPPETPTP